MMTFSVLLVAGCATVHDGDYCQIAKPIVWDSMDLLLATPIAMTKQIVKHNTRWETFCGEK